MNFRSDNETGAAPAVLQAVIDANAGMAHSYGGDAITERLGARFAEVFEHEAVVFPVASGTAANALSLAAYAGPLDAVYCHRNAHIMTSECGAAEFYTNGAKLFALDGPAGKVTADALEKAIWATAVKGHPHVTPAVVSITQATEAGTAYSIDEIAAIAEVAHAHGLAVHMDGARFANALVHLDASPAEMSWRAGVDVLSFGATKNGTLCADAVVFFTPGHAADFEKRQLRGGHMVSKMRFLSVQLEAYLADGLWLENARHANVLAAKLVAGLEGLKGVRLESGGQSNIVMLRMGRETAERLARAGVEYHETPAGEDLIVRLVTAFTTSEEEVEALIAALRASSLP